jgi:hypothetical protein
VRLGLAARNTTLPGWDNKPTRRPSAYMITWKFKGVAVLCVGQPRHLAEQKKTLSSVQKAFLRALQGPESIVLLILLVSVKEGEQEFEIHVSNGCGMYVKNIF